ncbi:MAG: AraC family transcriptional regulator, partial [Planctomycetota bacterium]
LEVAELCDLSRFQFCRRFAASTGYTPSDYLLRLRVEAARHHIANGATIVSAAITAGFSDQAHLTRFFSRVYGVSPGKYVKTIRDL